VTEYVRIRHYTNRSRSRLIEADGVIRRGAHAAVFCERARGRPLASAAAEDRYGLDRGHGRDCIEVDVPSDWVTRHMNAALGVEEWIIRRDVPLDSSATIVRRY
jgi:hypothetical protein